MSSIFAIKWYMLIAIVYGRRVWGSLSDGAILSSSSAVARILSLRHCFRSMSIGEMKIVSSLNTLQDKSIYAMRFQETSHLASNFDGWFFSFRCGTEASRKDKLGEIFPFLFAPSPYGRKGRDRCVSYILRATVIQQGILP